MKRLLLPLALLAAGWTGAEAGDYDTMVFRQTDGTLSAIAADGLEVTFSGGDLNAAAAGSTLCLPLTSLAAMYFTSGTTGITSATADGCYVRSTAGCIFVSDRPGTAVRVYNAAGVLADSRTLTAAQPAIVTENLPAGVYMVSVGGTNTKILVR